VRGRQAGHRPGGRSRPVRAVATYSCFGAAEAAVARPSSRIFGGLGMSHLERSPFRRSAGPCSLRSNRMRRCLPRVALLRVSFPRRRREPSSATGEERQITKPAQCFFRPAAPRRGGRCVAGGFSPFPLLSLCLGRLWKLRIAAVVICLCFGALSVHRAAALIRTRVSHSVDLRLEEETGRRAATVLRPRRPGCRPPGGPP